TRGSASALLFSQVSNLRAERVRMPLKRKMGIAALVVCTLAVLAVALRPPTTLSISENCDISGLVEHLKATAQGQRYWETQLALLDEEMKSLETQPVRLAKLQQTVDEKTNAILETSQHFMDDTFAKYPQLRPSPKETMAEELRRQADALEY